ncbi:GNAT family N-acetyltransferase [Piscirickettsia litoralis]|uniref:N-acetyltransferase domain-containing protein n=1 Tax=Piscirickettsia litoralis TaxID=1891921 RepID=A0ABX3A4L7_9GAMM|nr:GNAT family N-acetyltransferase [Piscirickettsia litoralis]ODN43554.1 hypothetical protein BGC07_12295 [Piscirickettsia litoralis]
MLNTIQYQTLNKHNIQKINTLFYESFIAEPWSLQWNRQISENLLDYFINFPNFSGIMATENNTPIAAALGSAMPITEGYIFELKEFFVHPKKQKFGIGTQLMDELKEQLKKQFSDQEIKINLMTNKNFPAARFYAKQGFKQSDGMALFSLNLDQ